jgi:excisionase family DNA binding protein
VKHEWPEGFGGGGFDEIEASERELVTVEQACRIAGVCRRTVDNWMKGKRIEFVHTAGGGVRIYRDTLFKVTET